MPTKFPFFRARTVIFVILSLACMIRTAHGKTCTTIDVRETKSDRFKFDKLKNCTKIVGSLWLVLLEQEETFPSFPELKEITDYLVVFNVPHLRSLGDLFPNLVVIRGRRLLSNNALIIHFNDRIRELGLSSLREIQRGQVQIGKCPNLCYVSTVNWTALGTSLTRYSDVPRCQNEECAPDCKGHCWSLGKCQRTYENCHSECLGCTEPNSSKHCQVCRNLQDGDNCVGECPADKFLSEELACVTKEECLNSTISTGKAGRNWTFEKYCLPEGSCPNGYEPNEEGGSFCKRCLGARCKRRCDGSPKRGPVQTEEDIKKLKDCTHIAGHLELKIRDVHLVDQLTENLGSIQVIEGCLRITRSSALTSLKFLRNLRKIGGRDRHEKCNNYTVFVYENDNLKTLIDNVEDGVGRMTRIETPTDVAIGFHDNHELCLSNIRQFALRLGLGREKFDAILRESVDVSPDTNGDRAACADIELNVTVAEENSTNATLRWNAYSRANVTVIGYTLFYISSDSLDVEKNDRDVSDSDMCNPMSMWKSVFISNNTAQLTGLLPFNTYTYWIKVHIKGASMSGVAGSTERKTFKTLPDDPSIPVSFEIVSTTSDGIHFTWDPPNEANGQLSYYQLVAFVEKDDPKFIARRNYCLYPHDASESSSTTRLEQQQQREMANGTAGDERNCVCETRILKMNDSICASLSFSNEYCNKYMYNMIDYRREKKEKMNEIVVVTKRDILSAKSRIGSAAWRNDETVIDLKVPSNTTGYTLRNLRAFTNYVILFSACNEMFRGKPQCSGVIFASARTRANFSADRVTDVKLRIVENDYVELVWTDPTAPNGPIVAYNVQCQKVNDEDDRSKINTLHPECVTYAQYKTKGVYRLTDLDPGTYTIRVRPVSLHGPGIYAKALTFKIHSPLKPWVVYVLICVLFVFILLAAFKYTVLKWKRRLDSSRLVASVNPDYESASMYVLDAWELDRNDIEIKEELGKGLFGLVFSGYVKSLNLQCAVKTVNEHASLSYKTEFLNEASVMKKFSDAHHVVKLYGVVSLGQPPLVVMELMDRGDLKKYLRRSRESSRSISSAEMYQMAAQVADGMAYLAAKKFVHRDLAARNCMVADDRTVKIGDFGMTRDIYETDYYRKGTKGLLPVRWMSPESLADGIFTTESDVWSYGVVLWEMATLAEQPYQGMSNDQVLNFVISRGKLGRPMECPDILWEIMEVCWKHKPSDRPLFMGIVEKLCPLAGPSFALVSFYHSKEGIDHRLNHKRQIPVRNILTSGDVVFRRSSDRMPSTLFREDDDFYKSDAQSLMNESLTSSYGRPTDSD